jgi:hypothetical protein
MVDRRLLDAALLQAREHRIELVLREHEVAHGRRAGAVRLERDPRA